MPNRPANQINTLANILAACVNSTGPSSTTCSSLFTNTLSGGSTGTAPTDTATAAINIAHNPGSNIANLAALSTGTAPFQPADGYPLDFTLGIAFTVVYQPDAIAIDASGDIWITSAYWNTVSKLSNLGVPLSSGNGFTSPEMKGPDSIAIDSLGNAWVANYTSLERHRKLSPSGTVLSGSSGFTGGGLSNPDGIAIDGSDDAWVTNYALVLLASHQAFQLQAPPFLLRVAIPEVVSTPASVLPSMLPETRGFATMPRMRSLSCPTTVLPSLLQLDILAVEYSSHTPRRP